MYIPDTPMQYAPSFKSLAKIFNFEEYVDLYLIFNASAAAPFHNFQHAQWAVEDSFRYYKSAVPQFSPDHVRVLLIAALFKDANHGTGRCTDETNITNAILTLQEVSDLAKKPLETHERKLASEIISSSLFAMDPHNSRFPCSATTNFEKAVRDADLSMIFRIFEPAGEAQYAGFLDEINLLFSLSGLPPLTLVDLAQKTSDFMMSARFLTPLGMRTRDRHLKKCLERFTLVAKAQHSAYIMGARGGRSSAREV